MWAKKAHTPNLNNKYSTEKFMCWMQRYTFINAQCCHLLLRIVVILWIAYCVCDICDRFHSSMTKTIVIHFWMKFHVVIVLAAIFRIWNRWWIFRNKISHEKCFLYKKSLFRLNERNQNKGMKWRNEKKTTITTTTPITTTTTIWKCRRRRWMKLIISSVEIK